MIAEHSIQLLAGDVRFKDHVYWTFYGGAIWKYFAFFFLIIFGINIISGAHVSLQLFLWTLFRSFLALVIISIGTFFLILFQYKRLTSAQRSVTWAFSNAGIAVTDKAGNEIKKPWSEVKGISFTKLGVRISYKPFGSFWIPKRWFQEETRAQLKTLTKDQGL